MEKAKINYLVDAALFLVSILCMGTGIMKLPALDFLSLHKIFNWTFVSFVHDISGVVLVVLLIIHLILHLDWIICMTKAIFLKKEKCEAEKK